MRRFGFADLARSCQASLVMLSLLTLSTAAQAAPRPTPRVAMQNEGICFIERSHQSTINLDRLCGKGTKRSKADPNRTIDLSIDVNRDGISDQLLEAAQANLDAQDAAWKQFQIDIQRNPSLSTDAINALSAKIGEDFNARMPYSDRVKQLFAEEKRALEQFSKLTPQQQERNQAAIAAKQAELYRKYSQDPSFIRVEQAQRKVYKAIERRGSAKWLYSPSSN
ncbi:MAG: hypothetical protein RLZZ511_4048 [Cyanobacteriota bacterium]|jgi:hypothetical protein